MPQQQTLLQLGQEITNKVPKQFLYLLLFAPLKQQGHKCWFGFSYIRSMWRKRKQVEG